MTQLMLFHSHLENLPSIAEEEFSEQVSSVVVIRSSVRYTAIRFFPEDFSVTKSIYQLIFNTFFRFPSVTATWGEDTTVLASMACFQKAKIRAGTKRCSTFAFNSFYSSMRFYSCVSFVIFPSLREGRAQVMIVDES